MLSESVPTNILETYISGRCDRQSISAMVETFSSTQKLSVNGNQLNRFRYTSIRIDARPPFLSFKFIEERLESTVKSKFPSLDFDAVLDDLTLKLTCLRNIIYSIKVIDCVCDCAVWNGLRLQCMMMLFLNYTFEVCSVDLVAMATNNDEIELTVIDTGGGEAIWKGETVLKCSRQASTDISGATATLEMKVPSSKSGLYQSKALQPKQQLLGQPMGLRSKLSYLTDIFSVCVMSHPNDRYYLSERVTDAKKFCLRLLLMCCGDFSSDDWIALMQDNTPLVDLYDEDDAEHQISNDPSVSDFLTNRSGTAAAAGPVTSSRTKVDAGHKMHDVACNDFGEEYERRLAEYADMLRWEAKCLGRSYLGFDELQHHNGLKS